MRTENGIEAQTTEVGAELGALLDAATDGIAAIDVEGRIVLFNRAAERLFGYQASQVLGRPVAMLMPEPYGSEHSAYVRRYLDTGEARIIGIGREVEARRSDGRTIPVSVSVGEVKGEGKCRFIALIRDLSVQRAAEDEARRLQNRLAHVGRFSLMGEMAAGIAHEINQPLSAIATYAHAGRRLLGAEVADVVSLAETCEKIANQAHRASMVIEKLRDFMRQHEVTTEALDINEVVAGVLSLVQADADAEGIPVRAHYGRDLPIIKGDAVQLQQVFLNLTRNAVDAMKDGLNKRDGIDIRTERTRGNDVQVTVQDRGHGVPPQLLDSIFHPFVTTKRGGLGVGLAISRTIISAHEGELFCRPNALGGTVFGFSLPAARKAREGQHGS
jgi:two-component system sensor kinase FixL